MAKRDGWRSYQDSANFFGIDNKADHAWIFAERVGEKVVIDRSGEVKLSPSRAIQFAEKVRDIAERAAKKGAGRE